MVIPVYVGFDQRESAVFHVFNQSLIEHATQPVSIHPLAENMLHFDGQQDGTNAFIFSRYLVPHLQGYEGWAIFVDGDMHLNADIADLWAQRDDSKAVMVVKHDYETNSPRKYQGTPIENDNVDYPRKNWSSVVLFNCAHPSNRILTRGYVAEAGGAVLHRFAWLSDDEIGSLHPDWNWLEGEYPHNRDAKLVHHTLGSPGFTYYAHSDSSKDWNSYLLRSIEMVGERPADMVTRAEKHNNGRNYKLQHASNGSRGLSSPRRPDGLHSEFHSER